MPGKQHRTARKPATKFSHLQKKLGQQKATCNSGLLKPRTNKADSELLKVLRSNTVNDSR